MTKENIRKPYLAVFLLLSIISCNTQQVISKEQAAALFYKKGLLLFHEKKYIEAEFTFNEALKNKKDFAPAYEGLARVYLQRGQLHKAENFAGQSLKLNKSWIPARIVLARIFFAEGAYELSRDELQLALKQMLNLDFPDIKSEIYVLLSQNDLRQNSFAAAEKNAKKALEFQADNKQARKILDEIAGIMRRLRGRGQPIQQLATKSVINRADLATLLHFEMKALLKDSAKVKRRALDVEKNHPAFTSIQWCLDYDLLPVLPDSAFYPGDRVDRAEMALFMYHILNTVFPDSAYHVCFDKETRSYADVKPFHPYFIALNTISALGMMDGKDGLFRARDPLSGLEAIKCIDRLKEIMRQLSVR